MSKFNCFFCIKSKCLIWTKIVVFLFTLMFLVDENGALANSKMHTAPVIVKAWQVSRIAQHRLASYRVFKTNSKGEAEAIPFQIDELSPYQDYILPQGSLPNSKESNGIFDGNDELVFMGEDVGPLTPPKKWVTKKPNILYELKITDGSHASGVYIGIFLSNPPVLSKKTYVNFNIPQAEIITSRYRYRFDKNNYLVVKGIGLIQDGKESRQLIESSTFYMKADLKYFLTIEVNHADINSKLEAYKIGPVRNIVRVSFTYSILNMDFELGMYTEVSFFSNSVVLPAIMYNPLDGAKSLNEGSGFYYGFAVSDNPANLKVETNLPSYNLKDIGSYLSGSKKVKPFYWVGMSSPDYMMYLEITPSRQMRRTGNVTMLYKEGKSGRAIAKRSWDDAAPLGKSPVNLGTYFDLSSFAEGQHTVGFRLFFENENSAKKMQDFKRLGQWTYHTKRVRSF